MAHDTIDADTFARLDDLDHWTFDDDTLHAAYRATTFGAGGALMAAIAAASDAAEHHPDLTLRYPGVVHVELRTHAAGGVTDLDVELARVITQLAAVTGATHEPADT